MSISSVYIYPDLFFSSLSLFVDISSFFLPCWKKLLEAAVRGPGQVPRDGHCFDEEELYGTTAAINRERERD